MNSNDYKHYLDTFIRTSLAEDLGDGDHTTLACVAPNEKSKAKLLVKENGILAGVEIALQVFHIFDPSIQIECFIDDGSKIKQGDIAFIATGPMQSLLQTERLVLNIMQRMSGIATQTRLYADKIKDLKTQVVDTRKTTPGMRYLEKMAVRLGGGKNHRMGLYDMILIKDNHVDFAGGIVKAIQRANSYLKERGKNLPIEIEVRNFDELDQVLNYGGINRIMLDNFSTADTLTAVQRINGKFETESSGKINLSNIREYAECGVDFISVGALTHQIKSLDLSLKAVK